MFANHQLPFRVQIKPDESLLGFLVRLGSANKVESTQWVSSLSQMPISVLSPPECNLDTLSNLSGIESARLNRARWVRSGDTVRGYDAVIFERSLYRSGRRFCPACLEEDPYHRMSWDIVPIAVCVRHGVRLLHICEHCGRRIFYQIPEISHCRCGFKFSDATRCFETDLEGTEFVQSLLFYQKIQGAVATPFATFEAHELLETIIFLGKARQFVDGVSAGYKRENWPKILSHGLTIVENWPVGFLGLLESFRSKAHKRRGDYGLVKNFGWFFEQLARSSGPGAVEMQSVFRMFWRENVSRGLLTRSKRILREEDREQSDALSWAAAARRLQVTQETLAMYVAAGFLKLKTEKINRRGAPTLVCGQSVREFASNADEYLVRDAAQTYLGIDKKSMEYLIRDGSLKVWPYTVKQQRRLFFSKIDLTTYVFGIEERSVPANKVSGKIVSFRTARRFLSLSGVSFSEMCTALRTGKLRAVVTNEQLPGFRKFSFQWSFVDDFAKAVSGGHRYWNQTVCAEKLPAHPSVVLHLCRAGVLAHKRFADRRAWLIEVASAKKFMAEFIFAREIAERLQCVVQYIRPLLLNVGISAVHGHRIDGCRQDIYQRNQRLEAVLCAIERSPHIIPDLRRNMSGRGTRKGDAGT